jgi:putative hydrolase
MAARLDTNTRVAALLCELAAAQASQQRRWGYRRAADAILNLDQPLESLRQPDGTLRKIPNVGPSSLRVIHEVLETGRSAIVERAAAETGRPGGAASPGARRHHPGAAADSETFLSSARVAAVLRHRAGGGVRLADYRGDLQMHSAYSDGRVPLADLIEGCLARGYKYCAVTDHSHGLPIARGVSLRDLKQQHAEIDALNRRYTQRFRMLKGIEANILADGRLDMPARELRLLELVVAAPHSRLRTRDDQTGRMVAAVSTPGVHILGHPRGRKFATRAGVQADWPRVFAAAAAHGVAIEIDGDPSRQDIDFELATLALQAGCLFALDSDAHNIEQLRYAETAVAHARLAGIPRTHIINCWDLDTLLAWLPTAWQR